MARSLGGTKETYAPGEFLVPARAEGRSCEASNARPVDPERLSRARRELADRLEDDRLEGRLVLPHFRPAPDPPAARLNRALMPDYDAGVVGEVVAVISANAPVAARRS
jgi:hypothetical protein